MLSPQYISIYHYIDGIVGRYWPGLQSVFLCVTPCFSAWEGFFQLNSSHNTLDILYNDICWRLNFLANSCIYLYIYIHTLQAQQYSTTRTPSQLHWNHISLSQWITGRLCSLIGHLQYASCLFQNEANLKPFLWKCSYSYVSVLVLNISRSPCSNQTHFVRNVSQKAFFECNRHLMNYLNEAPSTLVRINL